MFRKSQVAQFVPVCVGRTIGVRAEKLAEHGRGGEPQPIGHLADRQPRGAQQALGFRHQVVVDDLFGRLAHHLRGDTGEVSRRDGQLVGVEGHAVGRAVVGRNRCV